MLPSISAIHAAALPDGPALFDIAGVSHLRSGVVLFSFFPGPPIRAGVHLRDSVRSFQIRHP
jgi:hypothetical protein